MKILITGPGQYVEKSKAAPIVGRTYTLEDAESGTAAQNKTFHALLNAFYMWMLRTDKWTAENETGNPEGPEIYDFSAPEYDVFRDRYKLKWGAGYSHIQYVNKKMEMVKVKNWDEIPGYVVEDFNNGNRLRIKAILKSWADYTKKERSRAIENLKLFIGIYHCDDKHVLTILEGMEENNDGERKD